MCIINYQVAIVGRDIEHMSHALGTKKSRDHDNSCRALLIKVTFVIYSRGQAECRQLEKVYRNRSGTPL